jgi:hypothetical protein
MAVVMPGLCFGERTTTKGKAMRFELEPELTPTHWHELTDMAEREGTSEIEMLRRLIDRAYDADLWEQTRGIKPNSPPSEG